MFGFSFKSLLVCLYTYMCTCVWVCSDVCICVPVCTHAWKLEVNLGWCSSVAIQLLTPLFYHICMLAFMNLCALHVCSSPWGPEKGIRSPRTGVACGFVN